MMSLKLTFAIVLTWLGLVSAAVHYGANTKICATECAKVDNDYFWCRHSVESGDWDYCSPSPGVSCYNNKCLDSCRIIDGESNNWLTCKVEGGKREYCSIPPYSIGYSKVYKDFSNLFQAYLKLGSYHDFEDLTFKDSGAAGSSALGKFCTQYEEIYGKKTFTEKGKTSFHYSTMNDGDVPLLLSMRATLTPETTPALSSKAPEFIFETAERMKNLQKYPKDKCSYLLDWSLGGSASTSVNIIPQYYGTKKAQDFHQHYDKISKSLQKELSSGLVTSVDWEVVLGYAEVENVIKSRRAESLGLHYTVHYKDGKVKDSGDVFFTNIPSSEDKCYNFSE